MSDEESEGPIPPHSFFVRSGFPFVFLPTAAFTTHPTHASRIDERTTNESEKEKTNDETHKSEEGQRAESVDEDEAHRINKNDELSEEKSDLRISQPEYSQFLKELDFGRAKMVDVTNILPDELEQEKSSSIADKDENPPNISNEIRYETSSSSNTSITSDQVSVHQNTNNDNENNVNDSEESPRKRELMLERAMNDIQDDLNNLAADIEQASLRQQNENDEEATEPLNNNMRKRYTFDEDDDTSKQATQNFDLRDEDVIPSSKESKIPRLISQRLNSVQNENESSVANSELNRNRYTDNPNHSYQNDNEENEMPLRWEDLVHGVNQRTANPVKITPEPTTDPYKTSTKPTPEEQDGPTEEQINQQMFSPRQRRISPTSSSSSSTGSVVQHIIHPSKQILSFPNKQPTSPINPQNTIRQDSQETLIDENLDDLSFQLKQGLIDQERQTTNTSTKEERTGDGIGSMSLPLSTPDILSTDILEDDGQNGMRDHLRRRFSKQRINSGEKDIRYPSKIPENFNSRKQRPHHSQQQHHSRYSRSNNIDRHGRLTSQDIDDNWLTMLDRLEHEHKTRLERQQQEYEDYMLTVEEKMKRRYDDYLTLTTGFQESRLDDYDDTLRLHHTHTSIPVDSNIGRYKTHSRTHQYRPIAQDLISRYYPADSTLNIITTERRRSTPTRSVPRTRSRNEPVNIRSEINAKHAKHIADLRLYYEYEINELKSQLNRLRMGHSSSSTRQSIETIERINNENIRLNDEVNDLRHSLKVTEEDNKLLKKQVEDLRDQLNHRDIDLKNYHRTIVDLEHQLTEAENTKERQNENIRHAERQSLFYREDNEKLKTDLYSTRERLVRLEELYNAQEIENETLRRQIFVLENDPILVNHRLNEDNKINSTMALNAPTSKEYGRFTLDTTNHSTAPIRSPRATSIDTEKYRSKDNEQLFHRSNSSKPNTRIIDYINEKPVFPPPYVSPRRNVYSPRKPSPPHRRTEPTVVRASADRQTRHNEQLENKFDQLLKKKRDLESRLSRIPLRGLTNTDRQLQDVLEREIDRVEQQISSVKLELRKINAI